MYGSLSYSSSFGAGPIGPGDETKLTACGGDEIGEEGGGDDGGKGDLKTFVDGFCVRVVCGVTGSAEEEASVFRAGGRGGKVPYAA